MEKFCKRLKQLRTERGLTIKEVCSTLEITVSGFAHYEQGKREPSLETLVNICDFFDVTADYLLGRTEY